MVVVTYCFFFAPPAFDVCNCDCDCDCDCDFSAIVDTRLLAGGFCRGGMLGDDRYGGVLPGTFDCSILATGFLVAEEGVMGWGLSARPCEGLDRRTTLAE